MQVLIVDDDVDRQADLTIAFMQAGFQTISTGSQAVAESCIRRGVIDLLVMAEQVGERLTHSLSLLAEYRNPMVATMLLTARSDADIEELFLLLPSLHSLVAPDIAPDLITKLAIASLAGAKNADEPIVLTAEQRIGDRVDVTPIFASARRFVPGFLAMQKSA